MIQKTVLKIIFRYCIWWFPILNLNAQQTDLSITQQIEQCWDTYEKGQVEEAEAKLNALLQFAKENKEQTNLASCYHLYGLLKSKQQQHFQADSLFKLAIAIYTPQKHPIQNAAVLREQSNNFRVYGDFEQALIKIQQSISVLDSLDQKEEIAKSYTSAGNILIILRKEQEALRFLEIIERFLFFSKNN